MSREHAWVDGAWTDAQRATWPLVDRGLLFGDAVIETLRVDSGHARFSVLHRARLKKSLRALGLAAKPALSAFDAVMQTLPLHPARAGLRFMVTAGEGSSLFDRSHAPRVFALLRERAVVQSLRVKSSAARLGTTIPSAVKHPGYLGAVLSRAHGFDERLVNNAAGRPCELMTANLFVVRRGILYTPPLGEGVLPGVTRAVVLRIARRLGIASLQRPLTQPFLRAADELFATSALRGVCPISRLDDARLPPGPITGRLRAAYERLADVS